MTFPAGWNRRCELVIQSSEVSSALTDFPLLLTEYTLPSEMFDADGSNPAQNGGGDIRFSSDAAGTNQLPCEIVSFVTDNDPSNGTAEIWVKVPSVSSVSNTSIYVWYNTSGTDSQPAVTDTYGRNAVWSDYAVVEHGSDAAVHTDSTGNHSWSVSGTPTTTTGKIGEALVIDSATDGLTASPHADLDAAVNGDFTAQVWFEYTGINHGGTATFLHQSALASRWWAFGVRTDFFSAALDDNSSQANADSSFDIDTDGSGGTFRLAHYVVDKDTGISFYVDGSLDSSDPATVSGDLSSANDLEIGTEAPDGFDYIEPAHLDEIRLRSGLLSSAWIAAENTNQDTPFNFVSEGTPVSVLSGAVAVTLDDITVDLNGTHLLQKIYAVVYESTTSDPTESDIAAIKAGTWPGGVAFNSVAATANDTYNIPISGLTAGTTYKAALVYDSSAGGTSNLLIADTETGFPFTTTGGIAEITGSIAVTLDALVPDLNGTFVSAGGVAGSIGVTLDALAPNLNGTYAAPASRTGSIDVTLDALVPDLNGIVAAPGERVGTVDVTLDELVPALAGTHVALEGRTGSISVNLSALAPELVGSFAASAGRTGAITFVLDAIAPTVIGDVTPPPRVGDITVTLDSAVAAIYGYEISGVRLATPTMRRNADQELRRTREQALIRPGDGT